MMSYVVKYWIFFVAYNSSNSFNFTVFKKMSKLVQANVSLAPRRSSQRTPFQASQQECSRCEDDILPLGTPIRGKVK